MDPRRTLGSAQPPASCSGPEGDEPVSRNAAMTEELGLLIDGATNFAIYMLDAEGRVTIWNRARNASRDGPKPKSPDQTFLLPICLKTSQRGKSRDDLKRATAFGRIEEESWQLRKDGSEFLANITITALRTEIGDLRGFGKVVRDITDEKAAEAAVARREHHLRSILATVPDAMIVMNEHGTISLFSSTAKQVFGYTQVEVNRHNIGMLMPPMGSPDYDEDLRD